MKLDIERRTPLESTFRVARVQGMFDIPAASEQVVKISADIPLEGLDWNIGAIVGGSGSGKSTIAREIWPDMVTSGDLTWEAPSLVDDFPKGMTPQEITGLLTSVGFSSSPAWLRSYAVLSTGQKFRADLARSLAAMSPDRPVVFDEFTSTVDRTVAKAVCVATQKMVQRSKGQFVAVTCHKDIIPWLQPDWYWDTDSQKFITKESVQPRPPIALEIREGARQAWPIFRQHHYLSGDLSGSCRVFLAYVTLDGEERLAGFFSLLPVVGRKGWWRGHRTVVLPDYQGLGIGNRMIEMVAEELWVRERKRFRAVTSAPSLVNHRRRHPDMWRLAQAPGMKQPTGRTSTVPGKKLQTSAGRLTTSWVYLPKELRKQS